MVFDFFEFIEKIDQINHALDVIIASTDIIIGEGMIRDGTQKLAELQQQNQPQPVEATV